MTVWTKPTGEGSDERPRVFANHLGSWLPGTLFSNGERVHGWWTCYYDKGRFVGTFKDACEIAAYMGGKRNEN